MYTQFSINELLAKEAIKKIGVDDNGDDLYIVTMKCKSVDPKLFKLRCDSAGAAAIDLVSMELADYIIEDGTLKICLTSLAFDDNVLRVIGPEYRQMLHQVKCMMEDQCQSKV